VPFIGGAQAARRSVAFSRRTKFMVTEIVTRCPFGGLDLKKPVGPGLRPPIGNLPDDVMAVQQSLNAIHPIWGGPEDELDEDGDWDEYTFAAIRRFQTRNYLRSTGRADDATVWRMFQVTDGRVHIVVIDGNHASDQVNTFLKDARHAGEGNIKVMGVADMVSKVLFRLRKGTARSGAPKTAQIQSLALVGHGHPGMQNLGCGRILDTTGMASLALRSIFTKDQNSLTAGDSKLLGDAEASLAQLRGFFAHSAVVTLGGCNIPNQRTYRRKFDSDGNVIDLDDPRSNDRIEVDGKELLKAISTALGNVYVQAGNATQFAVVRGMEGSCIRCDNTSCWVVKADSDTAFGPTAT
jgi:hypothetical protein